MRLSILPAGKNEDLPLSLLAEIGVQASMRGLDVQTVGHDRHSGRAKELHVMGACSRFHALATEIMGYYGWGAEATLHDHAAEAK